jgi:hypothetical protein
MLDTNTPRPPSLSAKATCEMLHLEGLAIALNIVQANNRGSVLNLSDEDEDRALRALTEAVTGQVRAVAKLTLGEDEEGSR